ncbi:MAG TPA: polysaccharide lyase family 7 protein [Actinospica sp.]|nr:polysaccharide lyase family 7 protein [Actinospica sp.]
MTPLKWIATSAGVVVLLAAAGEVALATSSQAAAPVAATAATTTPAVAATSPQTSSVPIVIAAATAKAAAPSSSAATQPSASSAPVGLGGWAGLLLPVNSSGRLSGKNAMSVSPARLYSPWLTRTSSGALEFWAPSGGATTPGSLHSRTELESAIKYDVGTVKHELDATLEIQQLPKSNPEICVAQLHAGGHGGSDPFVMVDDKSGKLYVMVESGTGASPSFYTLLTNVAVGSSFSYRLADNGNGTLTFSASSGARSKSYTVRVPSAVDGAGGHFSAGDYEQGTVSEGSNDGGKVLFTALSQS